MSNDGSLASLTEQWIADQVAALAPFVDGKVEPWPGSTSPDGRTVIDQMLANRSPYAAVVFEGDRPIDLEEGEVAYVPIYAIYIAVRNKREGSSRKGETGMVGTNGIRDLLRIALHDKIPAIAAGGFFLERTDFKGVRMVFDRQDAFVMRAEVVGREAPAA